MQIVGSCCWTHSWLSAWNETEGMRRRGGMQKEKKDDMEEAMRRYHREGLRITVIEKQFDPAWIGSGKSTYNQQHYYRLLEGKGSVFRSFPEAGPRTDGCCGQNTRLISALPFCFSAVVDWCCTLTFYVPFQMTRDKMWLENKADVAHTIHSRLPGNIRFVYFWWLQRKTGNPRDGK